MKGSPGFKNALYYTHDHEWINFQGAAAYVGVSALKLTGIKQIERVEFDRSADMKRAGDLLAIVHSGNNKIPVHMPVDGEVLTYNQELSGDWRNMLLQQPERNGWVAFIFPHTLYEQSGLLSPEQYQEMSRPGF
ncbi:hypothetical protein Q4E93_07190 [Flavitalea sp. BT771]|nr:hypothetical protein [Flavitalea sp. BT771]MDO6430363.1 hypothetical protein [Flavitalea sp. BT771]MDV6219497.1 hypothetical protein [Flavitalea sp. BT771]